MESRKACETAAFTEAWKLPLPSGDADRTAAVCASGSGRGAVPPVAARVQSSRGAPLGHRYCLVDRRVGNRATVAVNMTAISCTAPRQIPTHRTSEPQAPPRAQVYFAKKDGTKTMFQGDPHVDGALEAFVKQHS